MPAIEFYYPLYPNNLPPTEENPDGVDPRNWITIGGGGGTEYFELTGAVTGSLLNGIVATTLNAAQDLPSRFLHLNYEDTAIYGDPYFLSNFLPITDPEPILSFVTQTGSSSSQTLRRWDMNFKTGLGNSVTNEFELSMYHSLLPGNSITPLRISYSIADARPTISIAGLLDLGNYNARSTASPISAYHLTNKGYVDYTVATYPLNLLVPTGDVDLGVYRIASSSTPVSSNHLTNKNYVDNKPLNSFPVTGTIDAGTNAIKSSYTPVSNADIVNKLHLDTIISNAGLDLLTSRHRIYFGIVPNGAASYSITFSKAFTSPPTIVTGLEDSSRADNINLILIQALTKTGCTLYVRAGGIGVNAFGWVNIIAIGT